jgi:hypothetical protein
LDSENWTRRAGKAWALAEVDTEMTMEVKAPSASTKVADWHASVAWVDWAFEVSVPWPGDKEFASAMAIVFRQV